VQTADFSPIFAKIIGSGAQYLVLIIAHGASDVFVKQWYDAKVPVPIGGIDVKSMAANFFDRVGGKSIAYRPTSWCAAPTEPSARERGILYPARMTAFICTACGAQYPHSEAPP